jgi:hypothetical protein
VKIITWNPWVILFSLKPLDNCVDVPREVCVRVRTNPRKVKRPIIKKWCYVPSAESGLASGDGAGAPVERSARSNTNLTTLLPDAGDDEQTVTVASTLAAELDAALTEETPTAN